MKLLKPVGVLLIVFVAVCSTGCQAKHEEAANADKALELSTQIINDYTLQEYNALEERSQDFTNSQIIKTWLTGADKIEHLTIRAHASIDSCFKNPNKSSDVKNKAFLISIVTNYKLAVLQVDTIVAKDLDEILSKTIDSNYLSGFNSFPFGSAFAAKLHNSIAVIANKAISYCNLKGRPGCIMRFDKFSALVGINSTHFKSGDELEITAGVGAFSTAAKPKIVIDDEKLSANSDGYAVFKKQVTGKPGKYTIPVTINFTSSDGTERKKNLTIKYQIDL